MFTYTSKIKIMLFEAVITEIERVFGVRIHTYRGGRALDGGTIPALLESKMASHNVFTCLDFPLRVQEVEAGLVIDLEVGNMDPGFNERRNKTKTNL